VPSKKPRSWGTQTILLEFAGQQYFFSGLTTSQKQRLDKRFSCVISDRATRQVFTTAMECGHIPSEDPRKYSVNDFYTPQSRYRADGLDLEGYGFRATIDLSPAAECQLLTGDEHQAVTPIIFENYLRVLAAYAALMQGGVFLHSAGIVFGGRAYLFIGRSGAGKSTLSRLALDSGCTILSDDANIVLALDNGGFQAGPVPFAGELGQVNTHFDTICPVAGIYWLEQSREASVSQIKPSLQTARILSCCPVVNIDPFRLPQMLNNVHSLQQAVPLQVLHFRRDQPFSVIRHLLEN